MYTLKYLKTALKQLKNLQKDQKLLSKVETILKNIATDPYSADYKFERLKHNLSGFCSKRLDAKNRIVYRVIDNQVVIIIVSILGHY